MKNCELGCIVFSCGSIGHVKECQHYPDSMAEMIDRKNNRIYELEKSLKNILNVAECCDNWEFFPSDILDSGYNVLESIESFKNSKDIILFEDNIKWITIPEIEDLIFVGKKMNNALTMRSFSEQYSEKMDLYFLVDQKNNIILNASFDKKTKKYHMIAGKNNGKPFLSSKDLIQKLFDYVDGNNNIEDIKFN